MNSAVSCFARVRHSLLSALETSLKSKPPRAPCIGGQSPTSAPSLAFYFETLLPTTFKELGLIPQLQKALDDAGYEHPTEIQTQTIPLALDGVDILGCAQTGTGKTAAFALPILDFISSELGKAAPRRPFALILAPTRELALQIGASFNTYARYLKIRTTVVFGGVNQHSQVLSMQKGCEVLVATPGRLLDLMQQGYIDLSHLEVFVLDEADHMLDLGFLPDLKRIVRELPEKRQSLFFSATLAPEVSTFAKTLLVDPVSVTVTPEPQNVVKIEQRLERVERSDKPERLCEVLSSDDVRLALVFTQTKHSANQVEKRLRQHGIRAGAIHGNKSQNNRQRTLEDFRCGKINVLVATDIAARGIDIDDVTHVINYDLPKDPANYVHRIGRTGRAGRSGKAITFFTSEQRSEVKVIIRLAGLTGSELPDLGEDTRGPSRPPKRHDSRPRSNSRGGSNGKRKRPAQGGSSSSQRSRSFEGSRSSEGSRSAEGPRQSSGSRPRPGFGSSHLKPKPKSNRRRTLSRV